VVGIDEINFFVNINADGIIPMPIYKRE